jgi:uncharacterized protein DUF6228
MSDPGAVTIGNGGVMTLRRNQSGRGDRGGIAVWSLHVRVDDVGLSAETGVSLGPDGVEVSLADFFADLAQSWRGWQGAKEWDGMEGGLTLSCTHDGLGHVVIAVSLRHLSGAGWSAQAQVPVDAGQLDSVTDALRELLTVADDD